MYLELVPLEINLKAKVTLEIRLPWGFKFTKTILSVTLWRYRAPTISKKVIDTMKKEEDASPPTISSVINDDEGSERVKSYCLMI